MTNTYKDNLIQTRNHLLNEISLLSFEELNRKLSTDKWSIAEVCHHLYLCDLAFAKAIVYGLKKTNSNQIQPQRIQLPIDRSVKVKAPEMVIPDTKPLEKTEINQLLSDSRDRFLEVLNNIEDPSILENKSTPHPLFGDLPLNQWVELLYLHEQRHIEQIREIKQDF